jgi:uncharacterized protein YgiM (DUF1202 family)
MTKKFTLILITLLLLVAPTLAQDIQPAPDAVVNPDFNISWPPPVYVLSEEIDLIGSVNLAGMTGYFIEYRPLAVPASDTEVEAPWFPVSLLFNTPLMDGILASWNTRTVQDGLYEIRLVTNVAGQSPYYFVVSPLRIQNNPPFMVDTPQSNVTATPMVVTRPTLMPTPTGFDTTPLVTAVLDANVRSGDGVSYSRIGSLLAGQSAYVLGRSSRSNGWYYIRLDNGTLGWIAPSTVTASGDFSSVRSVDPPATSTPIPTVTPIPSGNLAASLPVFDSTPTCQVTFQVRINVTNNGSSATNTVVTVMFQDVHDASGTVQQVRYAALPAMNVGDNYVVTADFNISTYYLQNHTIYVTLDSENVLTETNESDNVYTITYQLQQGGC